MNLYECRGVPGALIRDAWWLNPIPPLPVAQDALQDMKDLQKADTQCPTKS